MRLSHVHPWSGLTAPGAGPAGGPAPDHRQAIGHPHFWERAMSRGTFIKTAAGGTAMLLGAGLGLPTIAEAKAQLLVDPKPIPTAEDFGTGVPLHVRAPGNVHAADDEP